MSKFCFPRGGAGKIFLLFFFEIFFQNPIDKPLKNAILNLLS